jgi:sarcosine oxidase subunit gamma
MLDLTTMRQGPLDALAGAVRSGTGVELSVAPPCARLVLRCRPDATAEAAQVFGVALPQMVCRAATSANSAALCLGPDEWLLTGPPDEAPAIARQLENALANVPHALVDVSHRSATILVSGPHAAALLNHGCPLDLSDGAFAVGACTRTLFEKTEIVLWRKDVRTYHVETERSFAPYLWKLMTETRGTIASAMTYE